MKLSDDLPHEGWMWLKAILFFVIGALCVAALCIEYSNVRDVALLLLAIWAFCRFYYFCFYVIEKYIDRDFKFAGLGSVLVYLWRKKSH
jgi:hypothetical protein